MKGDFTRSTFDRTKHYGSVRMQQGRVQLDADWNEQMDITAHRVETEALDLIGPCGGPLHHDGFHVVIALAALSAEEKTRPENQSAPPLAATAAKGDFYISGGRYYVDGILCENEQIIPYTGQADLPGAKSLGASGVYLVYLDVWSRHVTALDDSLMREVALGGPDTATRAKNIAQVKLLRVGSVGDDVNCLTGPTPLIAPPTARLRARTHPDAVSNDPCIVEPGAGYRRLENQLYRVEIDKPGAVGTATFKWSRDDGSIVTSWLSKNGDELTVSSIGRDAVLRFAGGQWVELSDDTCELNGQPGTLVQLTKAEGQVLTINPATATGAVAQTSFPLNPKVRRWDGVGVVTIPGGSTGGYLPIEDGVEIRFQSGATYNTGDYWLIPARTATGDIEWPRDSANTPLSLPPHGIQHHYCRLAVLDFDGTIFTKVIDCRHLFPPVTELTSFFYLSGDGQEVAPDPGAPALIPLPQPLRVGVANGEWPVAGAPVQFKILSGAGHVQGAATPPPILTGPDGVATCPWELDSTTPAQQVEATLLDTAGNSVHLPVRFNANLSTATEVSYDPKNCSNLAGVKTVQEALDALCKLDHGGGSCCCVTVGEGGEFKLLDAAINELLKEKTDICICLMPGEHPLPNGLEISADPKKLVYVKIVGCGRGSRILLRNKSLRATGLASFTLRDLCLFAVEKAVNKPIAISGCLEVNIAGCHLKQKIAPTDLLTIGGAARIVIADNVIESWFVGQERVTPLGNIFDLKIAAAFEAGPNVAFQDMSQQFALKLGAGTEKKRTSFLKTFKKLADKAPATDPFRKAANTAMKEIANVKIQPERRGDSIAELAAALTRFFTAPALVVADANAETAILGNIITGEVRFYGENISLPPEAFKSIISFIKAGKLAGVKNSGRAARIEGNSLTQVVADLALTKQIKITDGIFGQMSLLDNTFHALGNQWLAAHVISNGNHFVVSEKTIVGTAAGASFLCLGTSASAISCTLHYCVPTGPPPTFRESANLITLTPI